MFYFVTAMTSKDRGSRLGLDICSPKNDIHDIFEEGECYGPGTLTYIST